MWTKESIELLLLKYQEHENLYNICDPVYVDRVKRSNSLYEICTELKKINKDVTVEAIKKIHTLRSQYVKELREMVTSKRSGVGVEYVYEPKLWCFAQLEFLKSHTKIRKSVSNISEVNETNCSIMLEDEPVGNNNDVQPLSNKRVNEKNCSIVLEDDEPFRNNNNDVQPRSNKRKKSVQLQERVQSMTTLLAKRMEEKNPYNWLGKQVEFEISQIKNKKVQKDTAWKIQQILREASLQDADAESMSSSFSSQSQFTMQERPTCSFFRSSSSLSFTQPPSSLSNSSNNSYSNVQASPIRPPSTDILQQSLDGLLDDEDY